MITVRSERYEMDCNGVSTGQAEVILLLAEGKTQRQIAQMKSMTHQGIEMRLRGAKKQFNVRTPIALVAVCFARGLIKQRTEDYA